MSAQCCHGASIKATLNAIYLKPGETFDSTLQGEMKAQYALGKYYNGDFI